MKDFADTLRTFEISSENLDRIRQDALVFNDGPDRVKHLDRLVLVNQQAFFILFIALFEAKLNRLAAALIDRMKQQADWRDRRVLDDLEHQPERIRNIPVMRKVALLTDKRGVVYRRIKELYDIRNRIAHGTLLTEEIDVAEVADELQRFAAGLNEAS
ncbi:hypothetical protein VY88_08625 [Azospirillum thiophilum]|uniref:RiboL-PSP-HEPN domain-containing protein n=1 Tax=Azospirillum thiophilum TaxID=528244 RepID=A0AAC8VVG4_9PROT|nr:hypothetical protein [Azospirillum thiophilum]ALG70227.1 hypothetical protein AL072_04080 [Azospirillum thiophilum]KJR66095.1 hypothetical protein VY88_08625 [Azospirillum thiophilum]